MKAYLLHTPQGDIVQWGRAADVESQARAGLAALEITPEELVLLRTSSDYRVVDGAMVATQPSAQVLAQRAWTAARIRRDGLLRASDWTDTASAPARLGAQVYNAWQAYRQALRDITLQPDPFDIDWPERPS